MKKSKSCYAAKGLPRVPGHPKGTDIIPAWLTPGEAVLSPGAAEMLGRGNVQALNQAANRPGNPQYKALGEDEMQQEQPDLGEIGNQRADEILANQDQFTPDEVKAAERYMDPRGLGGGPSMERDMTFLQNTRDLNAIENPLDEDTKMQFGMAKNDLFGRKPQYFAGGTAAVMGTRPRYYALGDEEIDPETRRGLTAPKSVNPPGTYAADVAAQTGKLPAGRPLTGMEQMDRSGNLTPIKDGWDYNPITQAASWKSGGGDAAPSNNPVQTGNGSSAIAAASGIGAPRQKSSVDNMAPINSPPTQPSPEITKPNLSGPATSSLSMINDRAKSLATGLEAPPNNQAAPIDPNGKNSVYMGGMRMPFNVGDFVSYHDNGGILRGGRATPTGFTNESMNVGSMMNDPAMRAAIEAQNKSYDANKQFADTNKANAETAIMPAEGLYKLGAGIHGAGMGDYYSANAQNQAAEAALQDDYRKNPSKYPNMPSNGKGGAGDLGLRFEKLPGTKIGAPDIPAIINMAEGTYKPLRPEAQPGMEPSKLQELMRARGIQEGSDEWNGILSSNAARLNVTK